MNFFKSAFFFLRLLFFKKKYDVLFSYNYSFNLKGNPPSTISSMINYCISHNKTYLILEDVDLSFKKSIHVPNKSAVQMTLITIIESFISKVLLIFNKKLQSKENEFLYLRLSQNAKPLNIKLSRISAFFFRKLDVKIVITLVSNRTNLWRNSFPDADIYDYQHGIIFHGDMNYLFKGMPPNFKLDKNIKLLTHSRFIKELLIKSDKSSYYDKENIFAIGRESGSRKIRKQILKSVSPTIKILFSGQNTADGSFSNLKQYNAKLKNFFDHINNSSIKDSIEIFYKNHPRAPKNSDLFLANYSFINKVDEQDIFTCLMQCEYHMTFNSSTSIEAAGVGIHTIFLSLENPILFTNPDLACKPIFKDQYNYPFEELFLDNCFEFIALIQSIIDGLYYPDKSRLLSWHKKLVEDFNEEEFSRIFKN